MADAELRTWKDGINEPLMCAVCQMSWEAWDHGVCHGLAAGRGYFGPLAVRASNEGERAAG